MNLEINSPDFIRNKHNLPFIENFNYLYSINSKMKIRSALIIDDEMDICLLLKYYLKRKNIQASYATSLKEGFSKFKDLKPDLLILDHNLPDGHGIENVVKFKNENKSLFIIVISAMSNLKTIALEKGADLFMEKPISFLLLNELFKSEGK